MNNNGQGFLHHSIFIKPDRISYPLSWVGHIPFLSWLIANFQPAVVVELGTHSGNSYLAACQAVKENSLTTQCFAVDTWLGDEHAGKYDNSVFETLLAYHQSRYATFSKLMRMTFDEAVSHFKDQSIDLLHIDGLHTYEAVKHDFNTWLPKLSRSGIVLFHDIVVKENNFGVWKLWEELKNDYATFEFNHAHGLGVLFLPEFIQNYSALFELFNAKNKLALIQNLFRSCGQNLEQQVLLSNLDEELSVKKLDIDHLWQAVKEKDTAITQRDHDLTNLWQAIKEKDTAIAQRDHDLTNLWQAIKEKDTAIAQRDHDLANLWQAIKEKEKNITIYANNWNSRSKLFKQFFHLCLKHQ